jgi:hypothetical protein
MTQENHTEFLNAIQTQTLVRLTFFSKEDRGLLVRVCAPMDFGPSRVAHDKSDRYHLWDFESDKKNHTLSLKSERIESIEILDSTFDPENFVTWDTTVSKWFIPRNWGKFS